MTTDYGVSATFTAIDNMSNVFNDIGSAFQSTATGLLNNSSLATDGIESLGISAEMATGGFSLLFEAVGTGISQFVEVQSAMNTFSAQTGASVESLGAFKSAAEDLFKSGFTSNFADAAQAAQELYTRITGLNQSDLSGFLQQVGGIAAAWHIPASQVVDDVGKMQAKFGELKNDPVAALDILTRVAQDTGKPFQKISDIVSKYGSKFASAGLSAVAMGGMIVLGAQAGISDQGMGALATAVDNFHTKVMNPPAAFTAAMKDMGLGNLQKMIQDGSMPIDQGLNMIFKDMAKITDPVERNKDAIALFGTGLDKIGGPQTLQQLAGFTDALGGPQGVSGAAQKVADQMSMDLPTALDSAKNTLTADFGDMVQSAFVSAVQLGVIFEVEWFNFNKSATIWLNQTSNDLTKTLNSWGKSFDGWVSDVVKALQPLADKINGMLASLTSILNNAVGGNNGYSGGGYSGGGGGGGGGQAHAEGGVLGAGWNVVGEEGPELIYGQTGRVYPMSGAGSGTAPTGSSVAPSTQSNGGGQGGTTINIDLSGGSTVIDYDTFMRKVYVAMQNEDLRRGKRN